LSVGIVLQAVTPTNYRSIFVLYVTATCWIHLG